MAEAPPSLCDLLLPWVRSWSLCRPTPNKHWPSAPTCKELHEISKGRGMLWIKASRLWAAKRLHPLHSALRSLSLSSVSQCSFISVSRSGDTLLAAQRSGSVIKTAVSGGLGVIGIVNVESSWGRLRRVSLCVKHTDTSAALLDLDVSKRVRRKKSKQVTWVISSLAACAPLFYFGFTFIFRQCRFIYM